MDTSIIRTILEMDPETEQPTDVTTSSSTKNKNEELMSLLNDIINQPEVLESKKTEELQEERKKVNPYGTVISGKKSYANISIINNSDLFFRRLHTTGLVGYLFRLLEEYRYEPLAKDLHAVAGLSDEEKQKYTEEQEQEVENTKKYTRKFLNKVFSYDPDRHVRSSYKENKDDPERPTRYEAFRQNMLVAQPAELYKSALQQASSNSSPNSTSSPNELTDNLANNLLATHRAATQLRKSLIDFYGLLEEAKTQKVISTNTHSEFTGAVVTSLQKVTEVHDNLAPVADALSAADTTHALLVDTSADVFHNFDRYLTNHYEDLIEAVNVLYAEKSDIHYAIQYMASFSTEDEARAHRQRWESSMITPVFTIENCAWTMLGPWAKNRERIDFYNKQTEVLRQMVQQYESDAKIGQELLKKKVTKEKAKNIVVDGPDDPGLEGYKSAVSTLEALGAKEVLSGEERKQLADAHKLKDEAEVPDDALGVNMYYVDPKTGEFNRKMFYTEAEAPKKPEENNNQPKKTIVSRSGEKRRV